MCKMYLNDGTGNFVMNMIRDFLGKGEDEYKLNTQNTKTYLFCIVFPARSGGRGCTVSFNEKARIDSR